LIGILLSDYFFVRRSRLNLSEAYRNRGSCFYTGGVNVAAVIALVAGFIVAQFAPASTMASLLSLFAAAIIYPVLLKLLYRKTGSVEAEENEIPELLTQATLSETPAEQP